MYPVSVHLISGPSTIPSTFVVVSKVGHSIMPVNSLPEIASMVSLTAKLSLMSCEY
jgi:hypothetical protein